MEHDEQRPLARLIRAASGLGYILRRPNGVVFAIMTVLVILASAFLGVQMQDWRWLAVAGALLWGGQGLSAAAAESPLGTREAAAGVVLLCFLLALFITVVTLKPYADIAVCR